MRATGHTLQTQKLGEATTFGLESGLEGMSHPGAFSERGLEWDWSSVKLRVLVWVPLSFSV